MGRISWLAKELLAFKGGICSVELVRYIYWFVRYVSLHRRWRNYAVFWSRTRQHEVESKCASASFGDEIRGRTNRCDMPEIVFFTFRLKSDPSCRFVETEQNKCSLIYRSYDVQHHVSTVSKECFARLWQHTDPYWGPSWTEWFQTRYYYYYYGAGLAQSV